jgi:SAM-dependent methyltransferase
MTAEPFDIASLSRNRTRARRGGDDALFLQTRALDQVSERLAEVNRSFTTPAVVSGFPDIWSALRPAGTSGTPKMVAEAEVLDLAPGEHDLIVHALSLHWANDPVGQMIQCRRALRPDGLFLGVLFGGRSLNELRAVLAEAESSLTGGLSPRVAPMAEIRDLGALVQRAGFALPVADSDSYTVTYPDLFALMRDLRAMGEGNALSGRRRELTRRMLFTRAAELYQQHFADTDGRLPATVEMITLTGWAPHGSQQQPLRPGSAATRLADALGAEECAAGEPAPFAPRTHET